MDGSIFVLGNAPDPQREREPNQTPAQLDGDANILGPPPAVGIGFADRKEDGTLELEDKSDFETTEDIEDLWQLDAGTGPGRLAFALIPSSTFKRQSLALLEADGSVLSQAVGMRPDVSFPLGTGVMLLSPPLASLPPGAIVGVDARDNDTTQNASGYELIVTLVPEALTDLGEQEPDNDTWPDPPILSDAAAFVAGTVTATDDDCFTLYAANRRLGVMLEMPDDVDVNLWMEGVPLQTAIEGEGVTEYVILEQRRCPQPDGAPDTVADCAPANTLFPFCLDYWGGTSPAAYTLTIVDFTL